MKLQLVGKQIEITEYMNQLAGQKISKLDKLLVDFADDAKFARVVFGKDPNLGYRIKVEVTLPQKTLFAQRKGRELEGVLNEVVDSVETQIRKLKDELSHRSEFKEVASRKRSIPK